MCRLFHADTLVYRGSLPLPPGCGEAWTRAVPIATPAAALTPSGGGAGPGSSRAASLPGVVAVVFVHSESRVCVALADRTMVVWELPADVAVTAAAVSGTPRSTDGTPRSAAGTPRGSSFAVKHRSFVHHSGGIADIAVMPAAPLSARFGDASDGPLSSSSAGASAGLAAFSSVPSVPSPHRSGPAGLPPLGVFVTTCSDGCLRFWTTIPSQRRADRLRNIYSRDLLACVDVLGCAASAASTASVLSGGDDDIEDSGAITGRDFLPVRDGASAGGVAGVSRLDLGLSAVAVHPTGDDVAAADFLGRVHVVDVRRMAVSTVIPQQGAGAQVRLRPHQVCIPRCSHPLTVSTGTVRFVAWTTRSLQPWRGRYSS